MLFYKLRNQMKWIIIAVVVAFAGGLLYVGGGTFFGSDPITASAVARVNGEDISEMELHQAYLNYVNFSRQLGQAVSRLQEDDLRYAALQDLVDQRLILQAAKKERTQVDGKLVDEEIERIKDALGDDYQAVLRREGFTERTLRHAIQEDLMMDVFVESKSNVTLTDEEVQKHYEESLERVDVRHILIEPPLEDGVRDFDAALAQAQDILAELAAGADFATLAQTYSADGGSRDNGGSIGLVGRADPLVPEFLERTFTLDVGEISEPVRTMYGYHIIQVTDKTLAEGQPFEEVADEYRADLERQLASERFSEWIEEARANANVILHDPQLRAYQLAQAGRLDQAIAQYEEAINLRPHDAYLQYRLAAVLDQVGADEEAIAAYQKAAELGMTDPFLWFAAGSALRDRGQDDEAKEAFLSASQYSAGNPQIHQLLAGVFTEMGYEDLAEQEAEKAEQIQTEMIENLLRQQQAQQDFLEQERALQEQIEAARNQSEAGESQADDSQAAEEDGSEQ